MQKQKRGNKNKTKEKKKIFKTDISECDIHRSEQDIIDIPHEVEGNDQRPKNSDCGKFYGKFDSSDQTLNNNE